MIGAPESVIPTPWHEGAGGGSCVPQKLRAVLRKPPTTPVLRQGGSGKQDKLSNFFLLPPSELLPVFPAGSQRAQEPG